MKFDEETKKEIYSWIKTIIFAIVLAVIFRTYIFRTAYAMSISMEPTLHEGQILIVSRINYLVGKPERGDIVVIDSEQDKLEHLNLIKRVVGLPGETVEIKDNRENSRDSRFESVGFIEEEYLIGKAVFRLWPLNEIGKLK